MKRWSVTVWASETFEIEAETKDAAEEQAVEDCQFPWADYCETTEIEDEEE